MQPDLSGHQLSFIMQKVIYEPAHEEKINYRKLQEIFQKGIGIEGRVIHKAQLIEMISRNDHKTINHHILKEKVFYVVVWIGPDRNMTIGLRYGDVTFAVDGICALILLASNEGIHLLAIEASNLSYFNLSLKHGASLGNAGVASLHDNIYNWDLDLIYLCVIFHILYAHLLYA
ncbi:hypothetical protein ACJX0J_007125, partial [Zea mays]